MYNHINLALYLSTVNIKMDKNEKFYRKVYSYITSEWEDPLKFYKNYDTNTELKYKKEVLGYFASLSIDQGIKAPKSILIKTSTKDSKQVLRILLKDFNVLNKKIEEKKKICATEAYFERLYYLVFIICSYYGINEYYKITKELILDENIEGLFEKELACTYRLLDLRYLMGYSQKRAKDIINASKIKNKQLKKEYIGYDLKKIISEYGNIISNVMGKRQVKYKIDSINAFIEWLNKTYSLTKVESLEIITREYWLLYINYICNMDNLVNKTKNAKLLSVLQFLEWIRVIHPSMLDKKLMFSKDDLKKTTHVDNKINDLAFKDSEDARRILEFLRFEYKPVDIYEEFYVSAIILAANSGMRRSEISDLEYGIIRFCEDTKLYIIEHNIVDKLSVKNRPIYVTEDGYREIAKVMNIRKNKDILTKREPRKGGDAYVHLFEYKSSDILYSPKFDYFIIKINKLLNIEKKDGEVEAGLHGYRHFFATEIFKKSGYDISTVKYLLRHKSYSMSLNYLAQEREKEIVKVREYLEEDIKYEGLGVESILNILFCNDKCKDYALNKKILSASESISELIKINEIKKLPLGYCLNPCKKADKCFKCNNFIIEKQESEKLLNYAKELFEIIVFKKHILKESFTATEVENKLRIDIEDLMIIIRELEGLGITQDEIKHNLKGEREINE
ncbi:site-specific integrase [Clostridium cibarium]|uniref:Site-specific integrase n=1 Tax=Clostridium cibarium TaxID=2762247 RepID=A0ABR8PPP9_9CLOT|nr:site-specific integrase [Clostridium cibarium]MBD7910044.1 site-specific integrase [Clostridium cibarium]